MSSLVSMVFPLEWDIFQLIILDGSTIPSLLWSWIKIGIYPFIYLLTSLLVLYVPFDKTLASPHLHLLRRLPTAIIMATVFGCFICITIDLVSLITKIQTHNHSNEDDGSSSADMEVLAIFSRHLRNGIWVIEIAALTHAVDYVMVHTRNNFLPAAFIYYFIIGRMYAMNENISSHNIWLVLGQWALFGHHKFEGWAKATASRPWLRLYQQFLLKLPWILIVISVIMMNGFVLLAGVTLQIMNLEWLCTHQRQHIYDAFRRSYGHRLHSDYPSYVSSKSQRLSSHDVTIHVIQSSTPLLQPLAAIIASYYMTRSPSTIIDIMNDPCVPERLMLDTWFKGDPYMMSVPSNEEPPSRPRGWPLWIQVWFPLHDWFLHYVHLRLAHISAIGNNINKHSFSSDGDTKDERKNDNNDDSKRNSVTSSTSTLKHNEELNDPNNGSLLIRFPVEVTPQRPHPLSIAFRDNNNHLDPFSDPLLHLNTYNMTTEQQKRCRHNWYDVMHRLDHWLQFNANCNPPSHRLITRDSGRSGSGSRGNHREDMMDKTMRFLSSQTSDDKYPTNDSFRYEYLYVLSAASSVDSLQYFDPHLREHLRNSNENGKTGSNNRLCVTCRLELQWEPYHGQEMIPQLCPLMFEHVPIDD
jgi:hypothetical protein